MTRKEIVKRAVHFQDPPRMPRFFFTGREDTDVLKAVIEKWNTGPDGNWSEWGFAWDKPDDDASDMGVPREYVLADWDAFGEYKANGAPDPYDKSRFDELKTLDVGDRYLFGSLYLTGFTVMMCLRGFNALLLDMYEAPERVEQLADLVFGFENAVIRQMPEYGFDCVALFDDWGMQRSMMISPEMWRNFFLPRYKEQCALAHSLGMDVFFHTCGYVWPIIGDLIGAGVDILNLGQADVNGVERLKEAYRGKVCFNQPINYQTTGISGTKDEILREGAQIMEAFSTEHGGLIPQLFDYEAMGWKPIDPNNTEYQIQAFCGSCGKR